MAKRRRKESMKRCDCEVLTEKYEKLQRHKFWDSSSSSSFKQHSSIYFVNTSPTELMSCFQTTHPSPSPSPSPIPITGADYVIDKMPSRRFDISSGKRLFEESDSESEVCSECSDFINNNNKQTDDEEVRSVVVSYGEMINYQSNCSSANDFYEKPSMKEEFDNVENEDSTRNWCWNGRLLGLVIFNVISLVLLGLLLGVVPMFSIHTTWKVGWFVVEDEVFLVPT